MIAINTRNSTTLIWQRADKNMDSDLAKEHSHRGDDVKYFNYYLIIVRLRMHKNVHLCAQPIRMSLFNHTGPIKEQDPHYFSSASSQRIGGGASMQVYKCQH